MTRRRTTVKEIHHGRTPAAWTGSIIAIIAAVILTFAFLSGSGPFPSVNVPVAIFGGILLIIAPIAGGVMHKMGLGQD